MRFKCANHRLRLNDQSYFAPIGTLCGQNVAVWDALTAFDGKEQAALFAHCASSAVNALHEPANRYNEGRVSAHGVCQRLAQADVLARAVGLDMAAVGWKPTVDNYLGRVTKPRILEAVHEAKGEQSARLIDHLKKGDMAREAERLLDGTGWLPEPLRLVEVDIAGRDAAGEAEALRVPRHRRGRGRRRCRRGAAARHRCRIIHACGVASATPQFPIFTDEPGHSVFVTAGLIAWLPCWALLFWSSDASIPDSISKNFDTLLRSASNGNPALMEWPDAITGKSRYVICAVGREGRDYLFTPFGHLADGNPYDAYLPPAETLPGQSPA
jgi:hypothetical protein